MRLRPSNKKDCFVLAQNLRPIEVKEVFITDKVSAQTAVCNSFKRAIHNFTIEDNDGEIISMTGIAPVSNMSSTALIYLLTSQKIYDANKLTFCRLTQKALNFYRQSYSLFNICLAEHAENTRFMEFLGADIEYNALDIDGYKFHKVYFK